VTIALGMFYIFSILTIKLSVLFLYRRIFTMNSRWFRIGWWMNFLFLFPGWTVVVFTLTGLQLTPTSGPLNTAGLSKIGSPIGRSLNALSDLMVLCLPVGMMLGLQLPKREKYAVIALFGIGLL
jgi:hypothetical protein